MDASWREPAYGSDPIEIFRRQVTANPRGLAVRSCRRSLTYAELDELSTRMANSLSAGPEDLVGVAHHRSCEMLACLLAILKRGAAYLPLDLREPPLRREQIVQSAKPALVLGQGGFSLDQLAAGPATPVKHRATPRNLAYVIFTSGSTGQPKGAMIERRGLMNNLASKVFDLPLQAGDGVAQTAPLAFDVSLWQMLAPLMAGARVEIMDATDLTLLADELVARSIHVLELVPSQLDIFLGELERRPRPLPLRWLIPTGEALAPEHCRRWFRLYPDIPLLNAYGPAECADDVTTHMLRTAPDETVLTVPLGKPLPHVEVKVMDEELRPACEGEICIAGVGVGRGYIGDPRRTAERFVPYGRQRLYRTGDLGRRQPDGSLHYLGRSDFQVKVRGERIELGEIEAALMSHPEVRAAVVIPWSRSPGDCVPLAFVVPPGIDLQDHLEDRLTEAMRPIVRGLEKLPLSPNGKVDRARLPRPSPALKERPGGTVEERLTGTYEELLGLQHLGPDSDFFELGGDSLTALRLVARLEHDFQVRLSPSQLLLTPTPSTLAEFLGKPAHHSRLMRLNQGQGTPLLFLPGAGGHVVYLAQLARRVSFPLYGLEAKGLDGKSPPAESVEEEVPDVIAALKEISPRGPYRLAGHSIGAWAAFEAARCLEARGERVEFVGLVGMPAPHLEDTYGEHLDSAGWLLVISELFARFFGQELNLDHEALSVLAPDEQLDQVGEALKSAGILPAETDRERMRAILRVYRAHHRIRYRPESPYSGDVMLVRTFEQGLKRPVLGWERYVSKPVEVKFISGNHLSMMAEPHVSELGRLLNERVGARSTTR